MLWKTLLLGVSASAQGIGYGGVDTDGEKEPETRKWKEWHNTFWDE